MYYSYEDYVEWFRYILKIKILIRSMDQSAPYIVSTIVTNELFGFGLARSKIRDSEIIRI